MESDAREPRRGAAGQGRTMSGEKSPAGSVKRARERAAAGLPPERPEMPPYPTPLSVKTTPRRSPQQGTSPTDRARYPPYPIHTSRQGQGSSGSVPLASSRPRKGPASPASPVSPQEYTQTSPIQERNVARGPPPQRPPRPNYLPPILQSSSYRDNQPPPLQYRKPQAQAQPPRNYWEDGYLDSSSSSRPLTNSTMSTGTGSSTGSIPDFPSISAMPTYQPPPRRNLGPPPSARKGGSSYYSQTSFVPPIPEENSDTHSSYASSTVIPVSWADGPPEYYMGAGIDEEEEEDAPGANSGRGSSAGDHDDASGLVRKSGNPRITSLDTVESGDESDRGSRGMQELDWQARQDERWRPGFAGTADTDPIGRHNFRGNARLHPYSGYESDATFLDSPTGESPMPRALKTNNLPASNAYFGTPSSTGSPVDPKVDQILSHLEKGGALASSGTASPSTAAPMTGKGTKRPPNLNLKATKEGRDSATSLPELIRRATKLASNLDRGKTASRVGMLDMLNAKDKESRERAGKGSRTGSISDILAAFPSPSPTTPTGQRPAGWLTPSPHGKSNLSRAQTVNYGSSTGHRNKKRRCCGMPVWAFILLLIILLLLIAAAVIIPVTLIVLPRQHKKNSPTLASCQTSNSCGNGGINVVIDKTCRCICANGYTGFTCNTAGDSSCTTTDVPITGSTGAYKNSTLGNSIPRLLTAAMSNYSIPITSYTLLSLFSVSNLSCSSENALVTFNSQSQRRDLDVSLLFSETKSHRPRVLDLEEVIAPPTRTYHNPSHTLEARGAAQTSNNIIFAAPTGDSPPTATSSAPASTSDEKTITSTVLDFARTAILFIFQETSSLEITTAALTKLQATLINGKTFDASDTSAGGNITVDLSALTVGFGNGTLYGGKGSGAKS